MNNGGGGHEDDVDDWSSFGELMERGADRLWIGGGRLSLDVDESSSGLSCL